MGEDFNEMLSYNFLRLSGIAVDGVVDVLEGELGLGQVGGGAAAVGAIRAHAEGQLGAVRSVGALNESQAPLNIILLVVLSRVH